MKKMIIRMSVLALVLTLTAGLFGINAYADEKKVQYVYDQAYLLNDEEYAQLNDIAAEVSERYQCAVHFVTTDDPSLNPDNIQLYAEDMYIESPALGYGQAKDGVMLVIGSYERCYWLLAYGPFGNYAFTDYCKDWMSENFVQHFAENAWYDGFLTYIEDCDYALSCAEAGTPVDVYYEDDDLGAGEGYGMAGIIGLLISFISCGVMKSKMKTVHTATRAEEYVDIRNTQIIYRSDMFRYQDVSRVRRDDDDDDDDKGRGGTTVNSRGFSGKGGSF